MIIKSVSGKKYRLASDGEIPSYEKIKKAGTDRAYGYVGHYGHHTHFLTLDLVTLPNDETVVHRMYLYCGTHSNTDVTVCNYDTAYVTCARCKLKS
jgi:acetyltransferase-like isoleucine patch superfamily enzyme